MARLLPNGEQTFLDNNGVPLASGTVAFYIPVTLTFKDTWQDAAKVTLNTNPVNLDAAGRAIIYGTGQYRQQVFDHLGNQIWDQLVDAGDSDASVPWATGVGGSANAINLTVAGYVEGAGATFEFKVVTTNTGATTIRVNGGTARAVYLPTVGGPTALTGGELVANNVVRVVYDSVLGGFQIANISLLAVSRLPLATSILPDDLEAFLQSSDGKEYKISLTNFMKVIGKFPVSITPKKADTLAFHVNSGDTMATITMEQFLQIIGDLDNNDNPMVNTDFVPVLSDSANKPTRMNIRDVGGLWRYIGQKTVSAGDATLDFKDFSLDNFSVIRMTFRACTPTTDDKRLQCQFSLDNGATWNTTDYLNVDAAKTDALWITSGAGGDRVSNANADGGVGGTLTLTNTIPAIFDVLSGTTAWMKSGGGVTTYLAGGIAQTSDKINALRFAWETGTWKHGIVLLEGISII